jgi:hypothetical protein
MIITLFQQLEQTPFAKATVKQYDIIIPCWMSMRRIIAHSPPSSSWDPAWFIIDISPRPYRAVTFIGGFQSTPGLGYTTILNITGAKQAQAHALVAGYPDSCDRSGVRLRSPATS